MKTMKILAPAVLFLLFLSSCTSVRVVSDYDKEANFNAYKTYAFYKTGIDKAHISDLDKKRILKAIDADLRFKGLVKSEDPDILVSIFTKEQEQVDVYNNYWGGMYGWGWSPYYWGGYGYGYGWGPGWGWGGTSVSTSTQGSLYIDLIDTKNKELVWQGKGVGTLSSTKNIEKREERIREFVTKILEQYPPVNSSE
ncbi:MAG: DUF4136 domain-containing protein [Maribacter sp.]|nr:DUF4136 domain-containing protein [Maribacter sp.]NNK74991.1 DUF4136 domain-containing protein [Maribacter sp.]